MDAAGHHASATEYPETDEMGEHETQRYISELLRALIVYWFVLHKRVAHVGANQFVYRLEGHPEVSRAPDVYVIEGLPQDHPDQAVWKTWEGHVPVFALEVVSARWHKDYDDAPADYDAMGTRELILFDPGATARSRKRVRWQVFRRVRDKLRRVVTSRADRVESRYLGCVVRAVTDRGNVRLRLATGRQGETLVPTEAERLDEAERRELTERIARETLALQWQNERDARNEAEARAQNERDARNEAEAALARARDELERLRREH
jgi:hypothetical protein